MSLGAIIVQLVLLVFFVAPIASIFLASLGPPGIRGLARFCLLYAWLAYGAATAWCLWTGFFVKSTGAGVGNGVFIILAIPVGVFAGVFFSTWKASLLRR